MKILGFEKLSLVDFEDKLGCTIFLGGCNFRCHFCHNKPLVINFEMANEISFEEILEYLKTRKGKIEAVCITGGEPTLAKDLKEKLLEIKKMGFFVKLDTNGTNFKIVKELLESKIVDYIAMDIKNSPNEYIKTIGINEFNATNYFEEISKCVNYLINNNYNYEFRTTLVEEFFNEKSINELGMFIKGAKRLYLQKFYDNENCFTNNLHEVSLERAILYKDILKKYVNDVKLRSY